MEEMLPLGYYNSQIEAETVMGEVFKFLFKLLDPLHFEMLGDVAC